MVKHVILHLSSCKLLWKSIGFEFRDGFLVNVHSGVVDGDLVQLSLSQRQGVDASIN